MALTIDELQIKIQADAEKATSGIDSLSGSLEKLKSAVKGGVGLSTATKQFQAFSAAVQAMQVPTEKISSLVSALKPLESIGKSNLGHALNQLKKLPEITKGLDNTTLTEFKQKIDEVTQAVKPLSSEMEKVSQGFSKLPSNIQKAINANAKLTTSNKKASTSYTWILAKLSLWKIAISRAINVLKNFINESTDYVENLNLFSVAMGKYAKEAKAYAEAVGDALGIDPSEWMRNQGVFMTLATGFGVASDKAAEMSKNLTALGYDLSSFFNISFADAMQKLQSGISGELEPLRRLGYDLSQAKLEAIRMSLGIDKAVSSMTQAEKAQLRYHAIMTQVTTAHGDMARTIKNPANQLRVFKAQTTQAARALGDILIPALNAILPYAIAFLKAIRSIANEFSKFMGYKVADVDTSGIQELGTSADDARESILKLKSATIGLDEINILQTNATSDTSNAINSGNGFNIDINKYSYDFLGGVNQNLDKLESKMKSVILLLSIPAIATLALKVRDLWVAFSGSKVALSFLESFGTATEGLSGLPKILQGTKAGFTGIGSTISPITKKIFGAGGLIAGFALSAKGGKELAKAFASDTNEGLGSSLFNLVTGGAAAIISGAMIGGPVGAVAGGLVAVTGALIGVAQKNKELRQEMNNKVFFADYGASLDTITQKLFDGWGEIDRYNAKQKELADKISAANAAVKDAKSEIENLFTYIDSEGNIGIDGINSLKVAFDNLHKSIDNLVKLNFSSIFNTISQAIINGLAPGKTELTNLRGEFLALQSALEGDYGRLSSEIKLILEAGAQQGGKFTKEQKAQMSDLLGQLSAYSIKVTPEDIKLEDAYGRISLGGNLSEALKGLSGLQGGVSERISGIKSAGYESMSAIRTIQEISKARGLDTGVDWDSALSANDSVTKSHMAKVLKDYSETLYMIGSELFLRQKEVWSPAINFWEDAMSKYKGNPPAAYYNEFASKLDVALSGDIFKAWQEYSSQFSWLIDTAKQNGIDLSSIWSGNWVQKTIDDMSSRYPKSVGGKNFTKFANLVPKYATGGFPEDGLFYANHSELVGKFSNGQTAVANNEQIVEGIKQGVKQAISESGGTGGDWIIQLVDENGSVKTEKIITAMERKNRRDGRTVIPIGI